MTSTEAVGPRPARLAASTTSAANLALLLEAFARQGGKPAQLLRRLGLTQEQLAPPDARIPFHLLLRAWELAPASLDDDAFGLRAGAGVRRGSFALLEYSARACATLGQAIERLVRYQRLLHDRACFTLAIQGDHAVLGTQIGDLAHAEARHLQEAQVAALLTLGRDMTGVDVRPLEVRFQHDAPASTQEHRRVLRSPVAFGAVHTVIVVLRSALDLPLREADAALAAVLDRCASHALERLPPVSAVMLCRELIAGHVTAGVQPRVGRIARELALSPRSLQRVLGEHQLSFRELVDDVRRQLALAWAHNRGDNAAQIAYRLGYADASAFHHAFRRWTGTTFLTFRKARR